MRKTYGKLLKALVAVVMIIGILTSGMVRTKKVSAASTNAYSNIVINIAKNEIGYKQPAENTTQYSKFFDDLRKEKKYYYDGAKNGYAEWCAIFVDWCFVQAYGYNFARQMRYKDAEKFRLGASCAETYNQYKTHPTKPQPGDQIFFTYGHTGLVIEVTDKKVITIEGNTKKDKNDKERRVLKKSHDLNASDIKGYGRPNYSVVAPYYPFINWLYLDAVGVSCSVNDRNKYVAKIGNTTFEQVMWDIYNVSRVRTLSNEEFANRLYKGLIGRAATANEIKYQVELIKQKNRRTALDEMLKSKLWKDRAKSLGLSIS